MISDWSARGGCIGENSTASASKIDSSLLTSSTVIGVSSSIASVVSSHASPASAARAFHLSSMFCWRETMWGGTVCETRTDTLSSVVSSPCSGLVSSLGSVALSAVRWLFMRRMNLRAFDMPLPSCSASSDAFLVEIQREN